MVKRRKGSRRWSADRLAVRLVERVLRPGPPLPLPLVCEICKAAALGSGVCRVCLSVLRQLRSDPADGGGLQALADLLRARARRVESYARRAALGLPLFESENHS